MEKNHIIRSSRLSELLDKSLNGWETFQNTNRVQGENPIESLILKLHRFNFDIWQLEEQIRDKNLDILEYKQLRGSIEHLNFQRNRTIESIDKEILTRLSKNIDPIKKESALFQKA